MKESIEKSIVLISSSIPDSKDVIGTGFLIYKKLRTSYILTCAHVIKAVGGEHNIQVYNKPGTLLVNSNISDFDLAIIQVDHEALTNRPCLQLKRFDKDQASVKIAGYYLYSSEKKRSLAVLGAALGSQLFRENPEANQAKAWAVILNDRDQLKKGYSGSPVVDVIDNKVLGVVTNMREGGQIGEIISIEALDFICESWLLKKILPSQDTLYKIERCHTIVRTANEKLREPFKYIQSEFKNYIEGKSSEDPVHIFELTVDRLISKQPYNNKDNLYPLYRWSRDFGKTVNTVYESVVESLIDGKIYLDSPYFQKIDNSHLVEVKVDLQKLMNLGYTKSIAKNGILENELINSSHLINQELCKLVTHVNLLIYKIMEQNLINYIINNINVAIHELLDIHFWHVNLKLEELDINLSVRFPDPLLNKIEYDAILCFQDLKIKEEENSQMNTYKTLSQKVPDIISILKDQLNYNRRVENILIYNYINCLLDNLINLENIEPVVKVL